MKSLLPVKFLLAVLLILTASYKLWSKDPGPVTKGMLDLRKWNPAEQPVLPLNGEWEFYWNRLLLSSDMKNNVRPSLAQLSIPWNEQLIDGKYLPKDGCATYALKILMPKMDNVSFAVPAVFNSYAFFVNDQLICSSGRVAERPDEMIPQWQPQTVTVASPGDTLNVIFQIANFQHTRGGCAEIMRIGTPSYLERMHSTYRTSGIALIILFFVTSLAGCIIYFIVRARGFLFLGLLSLAYTIRFLFSDLYFYNDFGLDIDWIWAAKIEYTTIPLIVLCASFFMAALYPQEFKRTMLYFFVFTNAILVLITFFSPSSMFSPLLVLLQIMGLALVVYTIIVVMKALIFPRTGAWVSALGTGVFALVGFYNIYAFITLIDLNRTIIHSGYAIALILSAVSLMYRTPLRLRTEEQDILRFSDFYK